MRVLVRQEGLEAQGLSAFMTWGYGTQSEAVERAPSQEQVSQASPTLAELGPDACAVPDVFPRQQKEEDGEAHAQHVTTTTQATPPAQASSPAQAPGPFEAQENLRREQEGLRHQASLGQHTSETADAGNSIAEREATDNKEQGTMTLHQQPTESAAFTESAAVAERAPETDQEHAMPDSDGMLVAQSVGTGFDEALRQQLKEASFQSQARTEEHDHNDKVFKDMLSELQRFNDRGLSEEAGAKLVQELLQSHPALSHHASPNVQTAVSSTSYAAARQVYGQGQAPAKKSAFASPRRHSTLAQTAAQLLKEVSICMHAQTYACVGLYVRVAWLSEDECALDGTCWAYRELLGEQLTTADQTDNS